MKNLSRRDLTEMLEKFENSSEKINEIIGTLEISLARQASKERDHIFYLDNKKNISELEDSLKIGADISNMKAKEIMKEFRKSINLREDENINFLGIGTFDITSGILKFKLNRRE